MKNLISSDKATIAVLAERLKRANSHAQYQRIQCVLIRATLGSTAAERNLTRITTVFGIVWIGTVVALSFLLVR